MSREAIDQFFAEVMKDETLQNQLQEAHLAGRKPEASATVVRVAAERGFEFTADEFQEAWSGQDGELSDEDLDKVAGGAKCFQYSGSSTTSGSTPPSSQRA